MKFYNKKIRTVDYDTNILNLLDIEEDGSPRYNRIYNTLRE